MATGDIVSVDHEPDWSENSELTPAKVGGRERMVVDHYGRITQIPFPGVASQAGGKLAALDIDVSRTDVVDETDETRMYVGPYLITVEAREPYTDSTLTSIDDLEQFAHAVLAATQTVRAFLANETATIRTKDDDS